MEHSYTHLFLRRCCIRSSVLRRVTTLLVAAGEFLVFAKLPTPGAGAALLLMTTGAMLAGASDLEFSLPGCAPSPMIHVVPMMIRSLGKTAVHPHAYSRASLARTPTVTRCGRHIHGFCV